MKTSLALLFQEHRISSVLPHIFTTFTVIKHPRSIWGSKYLSCALRKLLQIASLNKIRSIDCVRTLLVWHIKCKFHGKIVESNRRKITVRHEIHDRLKIRPLELRNCRNTVSCARLIRDTAVIVI